MGKYVQMKNNSLQKPSRSISLKLLYLKKVIFRVQYPNIPVVSSFALCSSPTEAIWSKLHFLLQTFSQFVKVEKESQSLELVALNRGHIDYYQAGNTLSFAIRGWTMYGRESLTSQKQIPTKILLDVIFNSCILYQLLCLVLIVHLETENTKLKI